MKLHITFIINNFIFLLVSIATHASIAIIIIIHNTFFQKNLNFIKTKIYVLHVIIQYDSFHLLLV
jgi:hypothetical protein